VGLCWSVWCPRRRNVLTSSGPFLGAPSDLKWCRPMKKERRRGDEYKALALMPREYPFHVGMPSDAEIIEMVRQAARKKAVRAQDLL